MTTRRVLRVEETATQRGERLRREMHAVGSEPPTPEQQASDAALAQDARDYTAMPLGDVLEREIKVALAQPYDKLWAKDRHQLIKAGVGLLMARAKIGPEWGKDLDVDETTEDPDGE